MDNPYIAIGVFGILYICMLAYVKKKMNEKE